ncbi:P-loop ATPase, Sll1717 family [Lactiplantibacillus plantarum]|uniref:P-loop ATPase, Sll1717 family n=1 Tax=Lactiplantibacillus plantarum TaxID=1590 RepID=UPI003F792888
MNELKNIKFGNADGKKEARRENFESLFYDNDGYFEKLCDPDKFLVIGRKGTGKTLLLEYFKKYMRQRKNTFVGSENMSSFISTKLKNFEGSDIRPEERTLFWQYFLLKKFTGLILDNEKAIQRLKSRSFKELKKIDKSVQTTLQTITENNKVNGAATVGLTAVDAKVGAEQSETQVRMPAKYYSNFDELLERVNVFIRTTKHAYYLTIDDIDELNGAVKNKEDFYSLTIAFINALDKVNDGLWTRQQNGKVVATLRTDLLDELNKRSDNLSKIIFDSSVKINWFSTLGQFDNPLMKMVLHKVRASIKSYDNLSDKELFGRLFPSARSGTNSFVEYLMKKSFGRPRDIVFFLSTYTSMFGESTHFEYKKLPFCVPPYVAFFYQDLENEINILSNRDEVLSTLNLIQRQKARMFDFEKINGYFRKNVDDFPKIKNLKEGLKSLFKLGVIGTVFTRKRKSNVYEFSYREGTETELDTNATFVVHDAIKERLSLV